MMLGLRRPAAAFVFVGLWTALTSACGGGPTGPSGSGGAGTVIRLIVEGYDEIDVGSTTQLVAAAVYADGTRRPVTTEVTWSSENPGIASVDATGRVVGRRAGEATIVASFGGQTSGGVIRVLGARTFGGVVLVRIECLGSCENITQGQGDFSYRVEFVSPGGPRTLAGTAGYPSPNVVIRLGAGQSYALSESADFVVRDQDGQFIALTFRATEWDRPLLGADTPDSDMRDRIATAEYRFNGQNNWIPQGPNFITLGSGGCRLRLHYVINTST